MGGRGREKKEEQESLDDDDARTDDPRIPPAADVITISHC
jgi:hypothetical protein